MNSFPTKSGISKTMSPSMILKIKPNPKFNHDRIVFGSYDLLYTGTSNNTNIRRIPSIELIKPKNNRGN